jgi:hypothetical protein
VVGAVAACSSPCKACWRLRCALSVLRGADPRWRALCTNCLVRVRLVGVQSALDGCAERLVFTVRCMRMQLTGGALDGCAQW